MFVDDLPRRSPPEDPEEGGWFVEVLSILSYPVFIGWIIYAYFLVIRSILTQQIYGIPLYLALGAAVLLFGLSVALFWFRDVRNRLSAAVFQILVALGVGVYGLLFAEGAAGKLIVVLGAVIAGANGLSKFRDIDRSAGGT
jgi:O-antigen/teichoic acid export membrane protein